MTNDELVQRYKMALEAISNMSRPMGNDIGDASITAKIALKEQPSKSEDNKK